MPDKEKYQHALEMVRLYQKYVPPFIESKLGYADMYNLRSVWQAGIVPIHEDDADGDKYEHAYSNWLWMARCSHDTLAEKLSRDEVLEYKRLLLRLYKQQLNNPDLLLLSLFKAHLALAKALLYDMQWMTNFEITETSKTHVTCVVQNCKILETPGTERICKVDCHNVGTAYASQVYYLKRVTRPVDRGCIICLTALEIK